MGIPLNFAAKGQLISKCSLSATFQPNNKGTLFFFIEKKKYLIFFVTYFGQNDDMKRAIQNLNLDTFFSLWICCCWCVSPGLKILKHDEDSALDHEACCVSANFDDFLRKP